MSEHHVWINTFGVVAETGLAERHETNAGEIWIPKSVICARKDGPYPKLEIKRWFAKKKGLIDDKDGA